MRKQNATLIADYVKQISISFFFLCSLLIIQTLSLVLINVFLIANPGKNFHSLN